MSDLTSYTYTLYAPLEPFLAVKTGSTYSRLSRMFPDIDGHAFKRAIAHVESSIASTAAMMNDLVRDNEASVLELATKTLANDDSSLQWSPLGSGRTRSPA